MARCLVYRLPSDKAEALSTFLKEHVKAQVLETRITGDSMTITTTPDTQRTIGQFVDAMRGSIRPFSVRRSTATFLN
jgi:arginine repressor